MHDLPKWAICGHGRSGKDTVAEHLAALTPMRFVGSTSRYLLPFAAAHLGLPEGEAWTRRHEMRKAWFDLANDMRRADPAFFARLALAENDLLVGVRSRGEIAAVRAEGLVDLVIWVDRDVPVDPTLEYGLDVADVVVPNRWGIDELHARLAALVRGLRLPLRAAPFPAQ